MTDLVNPWRHIDMEYGVCDACAEGKRLTREWRETEAWVCEECYNADLPPRQSLIDFHEAYGLPMRAEPTLDIPVEEEKLRVDLLDEEYLEYLKAVMERDLVEIADALADMVYIINGTALTYGINLDTVFAEVHRSNMSKLGADGKPIYREDGKVLKGPGYSPPDIARVLALSTTVEVAA